jgi:predicted phosphodiesterase
MSRYAQATPRSADTKPVPVSRRIGVISDVHGNVPALASVLAHLSDLDEIWCLGDTLDVLDDPGVECWDMVDAACSIVLRGNHEDEFAAHSPRAMRMPVQHVSEDGRIGLWHGSPRMPLHEYVFTQEQADASLARAIELHPQIQLILVGHTHVPSLFARRMMIHDMTDPAPDGAAFDVFEPLLACPGSVGQSHNDGVAQWLELDVRDDGMSLRYRAERYRDARPPASMTISAKRQ